MRSLLARIALRKAVGLYLGDHEIAVSEVAATLLGPVEISSRSEPCAPNELVDAVERILQPQPGRKRRRLPVAVGLPGSRVFFGTRPLHGLVDPSPEAVLQRLLCSANISVDDLTVDLIRSSVNKQPVVSVAACRKKYMAGLLAVLERCGCPVLRAEPAPCALARAAAHQYRPPRRAKTILRVFLGQTEGLAVLTATGSPVGWRPFALSPGSEGMAILSATRTLRTQSKHHGMELPLDYVMIHGRAELHAGLQEEGLPTELSARVLWHEGPAVDGAAIARGLALGCLNQNAAVFDLARLMKPRASLRDIFPWGELACEGAVVVLMGLILAYQSEKLNTAYAAAKAECQRNKSLASATSAQLADEKKALTQKIEAIHDFVGTRIAWTAYARDITALLPANLLLAQFSGQNPLGGGKLGGKSKGKSFTIAAEAPMKADGPMPREVGDLLVSLRGHPALKRDFPLVQFSGIKQSELKGVKNTSGATFTIVCLPGDKGAKGGAGGKKAKKAGK